MSVSDNSAADDKYVIYRIASLYIRQLQTSIVVHIGKKILHISYVSTHTTFDDNYFYKIHILEI